MGMDITTVVHFGAPEDVETYVQAVGRAGRDGSNSTALLLVLKGKQHVNVPLKQYCDNQSVCRREILFQHFDTHSHL